MADEKHPILFDANERPIELPRLLSAAPYNPGLFWTRFSVVGAFLIAGLGLIAMASPPWSFLGGALMIFAVALVFIAHREELSRLRLVAETADGFARRSQQVNYALLSIIAFSALTLWAFYFGLKQTRVESANCMTNKQLRAAALHEVRRLNDLDEDFDQEEREASDKEYQVTNQLLRHAHHPLTDQEQQGLNSIQSRDIARERLALDDLMYDYRSNYMGAAKHLRDEMHRRLRPEQIPAFTDDKYDVAGTIAPYWLLAEVSGNLEMLARALPAESFSARFGRVFLCSP